MECTRALALGCAIAIAGSACGSDDGGDANNNNTNTSANNNPDSNPTCGADAMLDAMATSDTQLLRCDGLGVIEVPIEVTLSAKPLGAVSPGGDTEFEIQVELVLSEATVETLGMLVSDATISEASADVGTSTVTALTNVAASVPCDVDFTADSNNNMMPGPVVVTTPVVSQIYAESDGRIEILAPDVTFAISSPPPLTLTTKDIMPACTWDGDVPTVSFPTQ